MLKVNRERHDEFVKPKAGYWWADIFENAFLLNNTYKM